MSPIPHLPAEAAVVLDTTVGVLSCRPSLDNRQRMERAGELWSMFACLAPAGPIQAMLAGQAVLLNDAMADAAGDLMRETGETLKLRTMNAITGMNRAFIRNMEFFYRLQPGPDRLTRRAEAGKSTRSGQAAGTRVADDRAQAANGSVGTVQPGAGGTAPDLTGGHRGARPEPDAVAVPTPARPVDRDPVAGRPAGPKADPAPGRPAGQPASVPPVRPQVAAAPAGVLPPANPPVGKVPPAGVPAPNPPVAALSPVDILPGLPGATLPLAAPLATAQAEAAGAGPREVRQTAGGQAATAQGASALPAGSPQAAGRAERAAAAPIQRPAGTASPRATEKNPAGEIGLGGG